MTPRCARTVAAPVDRHFAELAGCVAVEGRRVLDVGCGNGAFINRLKAAGAHARGLDVDPETFAAAKAAGVNPAEIMLGDGRTLPYPDASFDCVCFIFSFHHVPADVQPGILKEVERVLSRGGYLFIAEPEPFGPMTEVMKPIEDEVEVRTRSQALLRSLLPPFRLRRETAYTITRAFASSAALIEMVVQADRERVARAADPQVAAEVSKRFEKTALSLEPGIFNLDQPCRAFLYDCSGDA